MSHMINYVMVITFKEKKELYGRVIVCYNEVLYQI